MGAHRLNRIVVTDGTANTLASDYAEIRPAHAEAAATERQRNVRRAVVAVVVLVLHIIAVAVLVYSGRVSIVERLRQTIPEAITWIPLPQPAPTRKIPLPPPEEMPQLTAPITLPPLPTRPPAPLAPPQSGGLLGVGRSLACGASSYEYLSPMQREHCLRRPWAFVKKPDGTIVLQTPPKPVEIAPTTADIIRHEQQTAPPCPILSNVPCLGKVLHGDPLGGGPQPY
jgi:hypothetical protein